MLEELKDIVRKAGRLLKIRFLELLHGKSIDVSEKAKSDYVTAVDVEIEGYIRDLIESRLSIPVVGEEIETETDMNFFILVDPIDGTRNFMHGNPHFAINLAYVEEGKVVYGVTYDPIKNEMFFSEKNKGAFMNGERIHVSSTKDVEKAIVAIGLPYKGKEYIDSFSELYKRLFLNGIATRHTGSAALDLAYVACGRFDAFVELYLSAWDVASGILLIEEARGIVEPLFKGCPLEGWIFAASKSVYEPLKGIVLSCLKEGS